VSVPAFKVYIAFSLNQSFVIKYVWILAAISCPLHFVPNNTLQQWLVYNTVQTLVLFCLFAFNRSWKMASNVALLCFVYTWDLPKRSVSKIPITINSRMTTLCKYERVFLSYLNVIANPKTFFLHAKPWSTCE